MRHAKWLLIAAFFIALMAPAAAGDEQFTIRFGIILLDPTAESVIEGGNAKLDQAWGGGFDFEWYFGERVGLEGSIATGIDADIDWDGDTAAGLTVTPVTAGLNGHLVKNEKIDWFIGVLVGQMYFGDFDYDDGTTTVNTETTTTYGAQTGIDFAVSESGKWGIHFGVKYLVADVEFDRGPSLDIDPLIVKAMGVFRW
jgi:outer membrane protein W